MKIAVLTGGVGGAKFLRGLQQAGHGRDVTAIVNTGDDFAHMGLHISPDIDTTLYTLAGLSNRTLGWGREGESWNFMKAVKSLGGPDWFNLGDADMALHVMRTHRLARCEPLSAIIADFARAWGIDMAILPMSDDPVRTFCDTDQGRLPFQHYFVEKQCRPVMRSIDFVGAEQARPAPGVTAAIEAADAIFIAPSNPFLSIDPILAVTEIRHALINAKAPLVVISPIVGGTAVKGPTAKLMTELDLAVSNESIAAHYAGMIDILVHDQSDDSPGNFALSLAIDTMMKSDADKIRVAKAAVDIARSYR